MKGAEHRQEDRVHTVLLILLLVAHIARARMDITNIEDEPPPRFLKHAPVCLQHPLIFRGEDDGVHLQTANKARKGSIITRGTTPSLPRGLLLP